jgi:hypothetical protein
MKEYNIKPIKKILSCIDTHNIFQVTLQHNVL